jgi:hypothetical protein
VSKRVQKDVSDVLLCNKTLKKQNAERPSVELVRIVLWGYLIVVCRRGGGVVKSSKMCLVADY